MERHFDECLDDLKKLLLRMSALAESMLGAANRLLVHRDASAAAIVYRHEEDVDRLQIEIDELCVRLIALYQPAASDLRFILGAVKTNIDVERLADQAVNVCHKGERLMREPPLKDLVIIPRMATVASAMVRDSLHAYVNRDGALARSVIARDRELNEGKAEVTKELLEIMARDPASIRRAVDLLLLTRNLERVGDHATNIAENAIFVSEGKDVRHATTETPGRA